MSGVVLLSHFALCMTFTLVTLVLVILRCWLDNQLKMDTQINKTCKSAFFHLHVHNNLHVPEESGNF